MHRPTARTARRGGLALAAIVVVTALASTSVFAAFTDVPPSHPFRDDIDWLFAQGIAEGYPDGSFRPGEPVTRQAMAAFLHRMDENLRPANVARPFHLTVQCPSTTRFAVVQSNGAFIRGSAGTTSTYLGGGTFEVAFNTNFSGCAFQATVGQVGSTGSTTGWATVAGRSTNVNAVFVATFDTP